MYTDTSAPKHKRTQVLMYMPATVVNVFRLFSPFTRINVSPTVNASSFLLQTAQIINLRISDKMANSCFDF